MVCGIDRKLQLTAAFLGTATRKDLAAAFRRVNPATSFEVERANKWLQGRSRPRERAIYDDWAKLLDIDKSGQWIAACATDDFIEAICARHDLDPAVLCSRADQVGPMTKPAPEPALLGTYACYSHAWSPYFAGRLIRARLTVAPGRSTRDLVATYSEALPTGPLRLEGPVAAGNRALHMDLRETGGDSQLLLCLFPPSRPVSVLAGFMTGATIIGPDSQPSVTRIVIVRLPADSPRLQESDAYLPPQASVAADLIGLGLLLGEPDAVDRLLAAVLAFDSCSGLDQIPAARYRELVALLDQAWLGIRSAGAHSEISVEDSATSVEA